MDLPSLPVGSCVQFELNRWSAHGHRKRGPHRPTLERVLGLRGWSRPRRRRVPLQHGSRSTSRLSGIHEMSVSQRVQVKQRVMGKMEGTEQRVTSA